MVGGTANRGANSTLAQKLANEEARNGRTRDDGRGLARLSTNGRRPILGGGAEVFDAKCRGCR